MDLIDRAGDLKGELVDYASSARFGSALRERILRRFPDGIVNDEARFADVMED